MIEDLKGRVHASGEYVIIQSTAYPQGSEILSESGMLLGYRQVGEMPVSGTIISIGPDVPEEYLGAVVVLPSAHMANVPHPDLAAKKITAEQAKENVNKLSSCHYKAIQAIYGQ